MRALEPVRYVSESQYNFISIGILYEKGFRIQVQQGVITVSQGDRVILEGEKCEDLYKLKERSLEGSSSRDEASRRL